jgi:hypothetical protein
VVAVWCQICAFDFGQSLAESGLWLWGIVPVWYQGGYGNSGSGNVVEQPEYRDFAIPLWLLFNSSPPP